MNVLSVFDGMSCGRIALERAGIKVSKYYASEIDKHAIKVAQHNFPETIQLGDVTKWHEWDIDWETIDLLLGGSPCQGFSFAGKMLAFDDPRSKLFFVFTDIWNHVKKHNSNAHFLLENVKMKKEHENVISSYMGVKPIEINSALVSAQNRKRLYWTSIANEPFGLFGYMKCAIPQPKDKGILLRDILESEVDDKYYLSEKMLKWLSKHSEKRGTAFKQLDGNQKASCLTTTEAKQNLSNDYICVASRGRNHENPKARESGLNTEQMLEPRFDGKTNCLTSVQKDNLVMQLNGSTESGAIMIPEATKQGYAEIKPGECFDMENPNSKTRRGRKMDSKSNCLTAKQTDFMQFTKDCKIRRLTPVECERLQTVSDNYSACVADSQRYKMLGNGWTVDVICHILSYL